MRPVKAALGRVEGPVAVSHAWFVEGCGMQEVRTAVVVKVVESIAVHGAHQTHGTTVRDAPPFVAKAVQDQLAATAKQLLQRFTLQTIAPAEMVVKASFSDEAFVKVEASEVGPPRPWVRQTCQALLDTATEAANLLPAGDPLPAGHSVMRPRAQHPRRRTTFHEKRRDCHSLRHSAYHARGAHCQPLLI